MIYTDVTTTMLNMCAVSKKDNEMTTTRADTPGP